MGEEVADEAAALRGRVWELEQKMGGNGAQGGLMSSMRRAAA